MTEIPREDDQEDDNQEVRRILTVRNTVKKKENFQTDESGPSSTNEEDVSIAVAYQLYSQRRRATSRYSLYVKAGFNSTFGKLVILKVLLFDLAVSFGDAVTDILQGVYLIWWYNEKKGWGLKEDTWHYGLWVLGVCWVPGLVCVIHILSHYRSYQAQAESSLYIPTISDTSSSDLERRLIRELLRYRTFITDKRQRPFHSSSEGTSSSL